MKPILRILANGSDITAKVKDRLVSLSIVDEAGISSDEAVLTLDNRDGGIAIPPTKAELDISIGYEGKGVIRLGLYTVDEVELNGPPDSLVIRAKAARMAGAFKAPRSRSWDNMTIGDLVATIAAEHGYTPKVGTTLTDKVLAHVDQTEESDFNLLTRLAGEMGAVSKPAHGYLLFVPQGEAKSATGKILAPVIVDRARIDRYTYTSADRGRYKAVTARWRDTAANQDVSVTAGTGTPVFTLRNPYPDAQTARDAARAKLATLSRGRVTLSLQSLTGDPALAAEGPLTITGLHPEIDTAAWIIKTARHVLDGSGYTTSIDAEAKR